MKIKIMEKPLTLTINGKLYNSSYTKIGNKFVVDTADIDFKDILRDHFTFYVRQGKANYLIFHSKTEEIGKQIISQIDNKEHMLN